VTIERAIRDYLVAGAEVAALIGDRFTPAPAPQEQRGPFATWQYQVVERVSSFDGPSGLVNANYHVECSAETGSRRESGAGYAEARAVATAIRRRLDGYSGRLEGMDTSILLTAGPSDDFDGETRMPVVTLDFSVWHEED
jgi:hypothetical protein